MKRLILLPLLGLALLCAGFAQPAAARTRVKGTHPPVTRHKAHKAGRHHRPKHHRGKHNRSV